jgi:hypothetical protein
MSLRAHILSLLRTLPSATVVLMVAALPATAAAAQGQPQASPRELWRAYPLRPSATQPGTTVRLPSGSTAHAAPHAGDGHSSATLPIVLAVGAASLVLGVALGRRRRGAAASATPIPTMHAAPALPPSAPIPAPSVSAPRVAAPAPAPRPVAAPPVAPAPGAGGDAHPGPPAAAPPARRFVREPWPAATEGHWRCEITWRDGYLSAGFRAMAMAPDGGRAREVGRPSPALPWDATPQERRAAVDGLVAALSAAGWQPVGSGGPWYAARFVWSGSEPPPRKLSSSPTARGERR